jgi:hypothetical protein
MTWKFVPVVGSVLALAIAAAEPAYAYPAGSKPNVANIVQHAARNDACVTARAIFRAQMNEARFWLGAADRLAGAGNEALANQATDEANYYLGLAQAALNDMSASC